MAQPVEDAASVLESFIHDVANLPAETHHLLEELHAKNKLIETCRAQVARRDMEIQKHVKQHGGHVRHPSEEKYNKIVGEQFDKATLLQDEKLAMANKAAFLVRVYHFMKWLLTLRQDLLTSCKLDRHVKRLDIKIRDLEADGSLQHDPTLPSMLHPSPANLVQSNSGVSTGINTPLHPHALTNGINSASIANAAIARHKSLANVFNLANPRNVPNVAPIAGMQSHTSSTVSQRARESSAAAENKRRRLGGANGSLALPGSSLARPSSLGPGAGTPKAGTPAASSRAGSAGPARIKKISKKGTTLKKGKASTKKAARPLLSGDKKTSPSTSGDDDEEENDGASASRDGSPDSSFRPRRQAVGKDGAVDEEADDQDADPEYQEEGDDEKMYCFCQRVSYGDMVACDNEDCKFEWFHWDCVGLTHEPKGRWLCPQCSKLPKSELRLSR